MPDQHVPSTEFRLLKNNTTLAEAHKILNITAAAMSSKASPREIAHVIRHALRPTKHKADPISRCMALNATLTAAVLEVAATKGIYVEGFTGSIVAMNGIHGPSHQSIDDEHVNVHRHAKRSRRPARKS
jgi:hypothetical protein